MKLANIDLGRDVEIDPSSSVNNAKIKDGVKIAKRCSIYGSLNHQLEIGAHSYVGMNTIINGFAEKVTIGDHVSIAQNVNIGTDSGPNASPQLLKIFPTKTGPINIGANSWIGTSSIIMPGVTLGECCIVAANCFVNKSFPAFSIIGGTPARLIRSLTEAEKIKMQKG